MKKPGLINNFSHGSLQISWIAQLNIENGKEDERVEGEIDALRSKFHSKPWLSALLKKLDEAAPSHRRTQWCTSRAALLALLAEGSVADAYALSHTRSACAAIRIVGLQATKTNSLRPSAAIDIEKADRKLSSAALDRIRNEKDIVLELPPIQIWTLKEALFKADPQNEGRRYRDFCVLEIRASNDPNDSKIYSGLARHSDQFFDFRLLEWQGHFISIAWSEG